MKMGICVVLYSQLPKYIESLYSISGDIVAVDNGNNHIDDVHYISMNGNKGVAAALNKGLEYLDSIGCDIALTMDDDSCITDNGFLHVIKDKISDYGVLGLNINYFPDKKDDSIIDVPYWLTSGNFVNLKAWKAVGGYREDLFIDYVDFDFGYRLNKAGYRVGYLKDYSISHTIGNPISFKLFGRTFHAMNHPAVRNYYRYRNARYLAREDFSYFGKAYLRELFWELPKMLLFEEDKSQKLKMINRGIKDARKGKLGEYKEENC